MGEKNKKTACRLSRLLGCAPNPKNDGFLRGVQARRIEAPWSRSDGRKAFDSPSMITFDPEIRKTIHQRSESTKTVCPCGEAAARPRCALRGLSGRPGRALTQGGRAMDDYSGVFVGMDVSKSRIAVALAGAYGRSK
jgi:hypothetical protein